MPRAAPLPRPAAPGHLFFVAAGAPLCLHSCVPCSGPVRPPPSAPPPCRVGTSPACLRVHAPAAHSTTQPSVSQWRDRQPRRGRGAVPGAAKHVFLGGRSVRRDQTPLARPRPECEANGPGNERGRTVSRTRYSLSYSCRQVVWRFRRRKKKLAIVFGPSPFRVMLTPTIAPGARVRIRDAEWLVQRTDRTSDGTQVLEASLLKTKRPAFSASWKRTISNSSTPRRRPCGRMNRRDFANRGSTWRACCEPAPQPTNGCMLATGPPSIPFRTSGRRPSRRWSSLASAS